MPGVRLNDLVGWVEQVLAPIGDWRITHMALCTCAWEGLGRPAQLSVEPGVALAVVHDPALAAGQAAILPGPGPTSLN